MSTNVPRRMPIKTVKLDFAGDGYPDFHATARLNFPMRLKDEFQSDDEQRARVAALLMFPEWDFVDEEGNEIPHTEEGVGMIPQDLFQAMVLRLMEAVEAKTTLSPKADSSSRPTSPSGPGESEAA